MPPNTPPTPNEPTPFQAPLTPQEQTPPPTPSPTEPVFSSEPPTSAPKQSRHWLWILLAVILGLGLAGGGVAAYYALSDTAIDPEDAVVVSEYIDDIQAANDVFLTEYVAAMALVDSNDNVYVEVQAKSNDVDSSFRAMQSTFGELQASPELERVLKNREAKKTYEAFAQKIEEDTLTYYAQKNDALEPQIAMQRICTDDRPYYDNSTARSSAEAVLDAIADVSNEVQILADQLNNGAANAENGTIDFDADKEQALRYYDEKIADCLEAAQDLAAVGGYMAPYGEAYEGLINDVRTAYATMYEEVESGTDASTARQHYETAKDEALQKQLDNATEFVEKENAAGTAANYEESRDAFTAVLDNAQS